MTPLEIVKLVLAAATLLLTGFCVGHALGLYDAVTAYRKSRGDA